jgi:ABC-type multidrug transport system ATPase subunit
MTQVGLKLDVNHLTVRKGGITLVDDVSFSVAPGEFVAIVGPNGAGKTTLLRAIAGERPYNGSVCINGENLYDDPEKWFRKIGQIPVDNVLHERLPVVKALTYVGRLRNVPPNVLEDRINRLLEYFRISPLSNSLIYQLSSGERKKVNICAELLMDPGLLLLDEPTTNLDPDAEGELMEMLADLAEPSKGYLDHPEQGTTIVIVSHTINSLHYCNRVTLMGNSKIARILDKQQVTRMNLNPDDPDSWIVEFKHHRTRERRPTRNPAKSSIPCGVSADNGRTSSSRVRHRNTVKDTETARQHYWIVLARQIELLYYEGWRIPVRQTWERIKVHLLGRKPDKREESPKRSILDWNLMIPLPLLVALAFGPLTGFLLLLVLPNEALIHSANKGVSLDAGDASHAAFLIGLVAFLVGLLGTFREVVREINIYQHERLKGLRAKAYLLAKFTVFGSLYGMVAPILMFVVLGLNQDFPPKGLLFGGSGNVFLSLVLTSLAGAALGLAISCVGSSGEWATVLMGTSVIANALLSRLAENEAWEKLIDILSIFVPSRWAMEGLRTTTELYCWGVQRELRDHYSPAHSLAVWIALLAYTLIALMIAHLALHNKDTWLKPLQRLKPLVSQGNYVYIIIIIIMLVAAYGLYDWSVIFHEKDLFVAHVGELRGLNRIVGSIAAARCVEETPPSILTEESQQDIFVPTPIPSFGPTSVATSVPIELKTQEVEATPLRMTNTPAASATATPSPTIPPASTPTMTLEPTTEPSPTPPVPDEPTVIISDPVDLYFRPTTQRAKKLASVPANSTLTLLSQATQNGVPWLRVQAYDEASRDYVGWVYAASPPLSNHVWKVSLERKTPPDCAAPVASTYQKMEALDLAAGKLGTWTSDGSGEVAVVIDLHRDEIGTLSDSLTLHLQLNGQDMRTIPVEPQRKRFLLQNGVYNVQVSSGDRLTLVLTPSSSNTLRTLRGHVSIFFVPEDCEFHEG